MGLFNRRRARKLDAGTAPDGIAPDGKYDRAELETFAADTTGIDRATITAVLDLYDEYLDAVGIAEPAPDQTFAHYDPADFAGPPPIVDPAKVADDAPRFLGVDRAVASKVLDAEFGYLEAKGLTS